MQRAQYRKQANAYQLKRLEKVKFALLNTWDILGDKALLLLNRGVFATSVIWTILITLFTKFS